MSTAAAWRPARLGEFFEIKHGFAFKGEHFAAEGEHVLLTPGNFNEEGGLHLKGDREKFYSGPIPEDFILAAGDMVLAMTDLTQQAPILGSAAMIPQDDRFLHNQRLGKIVNLKEDDLDKAFLYYLFNSQPVRAQIKATATGATVRHTAPTRIYDVKVCLPPPCEQRRIAGILSAYDDLVENCQRRIRILEEMARRLYREWFVHFRYPGYESMPRIDSPLGPIPQGWEVKGIKDLAQVTYGFAFKSQQFNTDGVGTPIVRIRDIPKGTAETYTDEEAHPKYHIRDGHILVGMDGDFHMCVWSAGPALQVQRVARFEPTGLVGNYLLFLLLEGPIQELNKSIVGTTVAHLGDSHIKAIQVAIPPPAVLSCMNSTLDPILEQVIILKKSTANLRRTRDLLLPRLLGGS